MRMLLIGAAGALGAVCRYTVSIAVGPQRFPWATVAINVVGSFVLAVVVGLAPARHWSPDATAAVAVGFVGAFTTYSTFSLEALTLGRTGRMAAAVAYVAVSLALGLAAADVGRRVAHAIGR